MAEHEKTTLREAGSKGGETRAEKYSKEELSEQAKRAAHTVEQRHPGFHSEIGKKAGKHEVLNGIKKLKYLEVEKLLVEKEKSKAM